MEWAQRFDIVRQKIKEKLTGEGVRDTDEKVAELLGVSPPSYKRWRNGFMPSTAGLVAIAEKLDISLDWLILGKTHPDKAALAPPLASINRQGLLTGDLLRVVLDWIRKFDPEVEKNTGLDAESLKNLLENRSLPSFEQLEALYLNLGINPAYFFDGNELAMWLPKDMLLRALWAIGKAGQHPTDALLVEAFGISWEEAEIFIKEWEDVREKGGDWFLDNKLLKALAERYSFYPGWLLSASPPLAMLRQETKTGVPAPEDDKDQTIRRLQEELLQAQREIITLLYKERGQAADHAQESPVLGSSSAVPLSHASTDKEQS